MKILAINGSARKKGNTHDMLVAALAPLEAVGHECEMVSLAAEDVRGCTACGKCKEKRDRACHGRKDFIAEIMGKVWEADVLFLGSPTYFGDVSTEMKAFIDRIGYVAMANGGLLRRKVGAAVVTARRGGAIHTFDTINHLFTISEMVTVGSSYWNVGLGAPIGAVKENDEEGMETMRKLGENTAWLLEKLGRV
ncbi:MAG: flavodoxin family protein [Coriobacteriia bacterium]|nr:flavodoxin family protein [Coriobacteriia bacterium]